MIAHPENEPFFFPGGPTGVLLTHGFSSGPSQMRMFGNFLHACNITVRGVLLAGHGTQPDDLRGTTWRDWYRSVEEGYYQLRGYGCERVYAAGLSIGGVLSLHLAKERPLDGLIAINTPIYLPPIIRTAIDLFGSRVQYTTKTLNDVADASAQALQHSYPRTPVEVYNSMIDVLDIVRGELPQITAPALVIYARNDRTVSSWNSHRIYEQLGSRSKQLVVLHRSYHVATIDYDRGDVFARTHDFITKHGGVGVRSLTDH